MNGSPSASKKGLHSLGRRIDKSQSTLDRGQLEREIGRLFKRNSEKQNGENLSSNHYGLFL